MLISPLGPRQKQDKFKEVLWKACSDEDDRRRFCNSCRSRYLTGSDWPSPKSRANKISPVINRKSAFVYSGEGLKFWLEPPVNEDLAESVPRLETASEALEQEWYTSGTDDVFNIGVTWAYVYGTEIACTMPTWDNRANTPHLKSYLIHPADFSVLRREIPDLQQQEAFVLTTYISMPEVMRRVRYHKRDTQIIKSLEACYEGEGVTSGASGSIIMGYAPTGPNTFRANYMAGTRGPYASTRSPLELYKWRDIYYFDDLFGAWFCATMSGDEVVFNRPIERMGFGAFPPFTKICPRPLPDYFWGISEVEQLSGLQDWWTYRSDQVDRFMAKQLRPSRAGIGMGKSYEEQLAVLDRPGGRAAFPNQGTVIQEFKTEMPNGAFDLLEMIESFFTDQSGLRPSLFGKQEPGVRTEGMAASTMRLSAAEVRKEAKTVEKNVQDHGDVLFDLMQRFHDDIMIDDNGKKFFLAQMPQNIHVHVDGSSSSPVFVEDHAQLAMALRRFGDITPEKFIELLHPAMKGSLIYDTKKVQYVKMLAQEVVKIQQEQKRMGAGEKKE
jgi:hypothetical protein